jgi:PIN domain
MTLLSRNLIIDTQYFINKSFDFESTELNSLSELAKKNYVAVFITDITDREIKKKIYEEISITHEKLLTSNLRYLKAVPLFRRFLATYDLSRLMYFFISKYETFKTNCKVSIITSDQVKLLDVFEDYCNQRLPFSNSKNNKKHEFPDAFALKAIKEWAEKEDLKAYLLSGDSDWELYANHQYAGLLSNNLRFNHILELSAFTDLVYKTEDLLQNIVAFSGQTIDRKFEIITQHVLTELNNTKFRCDSEEDIEIQEKYLLGIELLNKEIVVGDRDGAVYNLDLAITGIFKFEVPDYDTPYYDLDERAYVGLNWVESYEKIVFEEAIEIEIAFEDGLESNFNIASSKIPDKIYIPFGQGEIVDPVVWASTMPVIVCGVKNGKITENGLGSMEFPNIQKAKETFPSLDIYKHSKDFTWAMGDKITGKLRFETWKAYEVYSS